MIHIRVPATTANLGPGFDCMGLALAAYGHFYFEERESGLEFENIAPQFCNEDNLAVTAYRRAMQEMGKEMKGLYLCIKSDIPVSSGLGSSASLLVAGVVAANEIHGRPFSRDVLLNLVTELEGHPDNVAPALLGGLTASMMAEGHAVSVRYPINDDVRICVLIPDFELSTKEARAALPTAITLPDAVFNVSRATVLLKALEMGDWRLVGLAMDDKLHQPYRAKLIREYDKVKQLAMDCGAAAFCISGAGPTLLCVCHDDHFADRMSQAVQQCENKWRVLQLEVDHEGAKVIEE